MGELTEWILFLEGMEWNVLTQGEVGSGVVVSDKSTSEERFGFVEVIGRGYGDVVERQFFVNVVFIPS